MCWSCHPYRRRKGLRVRLPFRERSLCPIQWSGTSVRREGGELLRRPAFESPMVVWLRPDRRR